jgi:putative flippase GtrA
MKSRIPVDASPREPDGGRQTPSAIERARFVRFLVTGGVAAVVNLVSRYLLNLRISFAPAVAIAYFLGMITAYVLGRLFVFEGSGRSVADEFWRFAVVNLLAATQVWVVSMALGEYAFPVLGFQWHPLDVAHLIGVAVPVFSSYLGHRHFSFARIAGREPEQLLRASTVESD